MPAVAARPSSFSLNKMYWKSIKHTRTDDKAGEWRGCTQEVVKRKRRRDEMSTLMGRGPPRYAY